MSYDPNRPEGFGREPDDTNPPGEEPTADDPAASAERHDADSAVDGPERSGESRAEAAMVPAWDAPSPFAADRRADEPVEAPWEPEDPFLDVPASLELAYTTADVGLSPDAYDRTFPYERAAQKRRRRDTAARLRRYGRELAETAILALLIFFAVKAVVQNFRVEGSSMEPSLSGEELVLVNKAIYFRVDFDRIARFIPFVDGDDGRERYLFRSPRRGDVIVFRYPQDTSRDFIKRVIGVPGDTVEVRDQTVFINGAPLQEDYILATPNYTYGPRTVPGGHYFVLGDNRRNSFDSHAWPQNCGGLQTCDFVPEENIIGQAWLRYWPFDVFGLVNNRSLNPSVP
jgi:signal peptidase I